MPELLLALGCVILAAVGIYKLVAIYRNQLRRERRARREQPPPDFSFLENGNIPWAEEVDDGEEPIELELADEEQVGVPYTLSVEPHPVKGTRVTVRQAQMRAERLLDASMDAERNGDDALAEELAMKALAEIDAGTGRDHWYAPHVLNWLGCLRYNNGFTVEGNEYWEQAEQIAIEWYEQCQHVLPTIRSNMALFRRYF